MAKGWDKVEQATSAANEARERAQQNSLPQLFAKAVRPDKGGSPVVVRFLEQEQDVNAFERHEYQVPDGRGGFNRRLFTCLREIGQTCPGCQAGLKLKTRGVYNIIQRNRPVLRKGQDGKAIKGPDQNHIVDGYADQVVILDVPSTTAEALRKKDGNYHGLMSRDLILSSSGDTFQPWSIEPADIDAGPTPMSQNDMALAAAKHDLDAFMKPPSYDEAVSLIQRFGANSGANLGAIGMQQQPGQPMAAPPQGNATQVAPANGFLAGAQVATGVGGQPSPAFGAAQQVAAAAQLAPAQPPVPQPQAEPGTGQPAVPVVQSPVQPVATQPPPVAQPAPVPVAPQSQQ